jgi:hypothetical protein
MWHNSTYNRPDDRRESGVKQGKRRNESWSECLGMQFLYIREQWGCCGFKWIWVWNSYEFIQIKLCLDWDHHFLAIRNWLGYVREVLSIGWSILHRGLGCWSGWKRDDTKELTLKVLWQAHHVYMVCKPWIWGDPGLEKTIEERGKGRGEERVQLEIEPRQHDCQAVRLTGSMLISRVSVCANFCSIVGQAF